MKVVALSAGRWRWVTARSAGVEPWVWPPARSREELHQLEDELEGCDFLYVNLHGMEGQGYWYGDGFVTAFSADWLRGVDLRGAVAYVTACGGLERGDAGDRQSPLHAGPMVQALLDAGCAAVIAGDGSNYGGEWDAQGVDTLGKWLRRWLSWGVPVGRAFLLARAAIAPAALVRREERDALGFRLLGDGSAFGDRSRNPQRLGTGAADLERNAVPKGGRGRTGTSAPTGDGLVTRGAILERAGVPKARFGDYRPPNWPPAPDELFIPVKSGADGGVGSAE